MKIKLTWLLIILPIIALIITIACGVPVLGWVSWLLNLISKMFGWVGWLCGWLQDMIGKGIFG